MASLKFAFVIGKYICCTMIRWSIYFLTMIIDDKFDPMRHPIWEATALCFETWNDSPVSKPERISLLCSSSMPHNDPRFNYMGLPTYCRPAGCSYSFRLCGPVVIEEQVQQRIKLLKFITIIICVTINRTMFLQSVTDSLWWIRIIGVSHMLDIFPLLISRFRIDVWEWWISQVIRGERHLCRRWSSLGITYRKM